MRTDWYNRGYLDQTWGHPLEDEIFKNPESLSYPMSALAKYREGRIKAYKDGYGQKPDFYEDESDIT